MTSEPTPPAAGAPSGNVFFAWLRDLGIVRSSDRWFAGVAGGIAEKTGIDPLLVRGAFVVLSLIGGPGLLLYLAGWFLLPDASGKIHLEEIFRGRASSGMLTAAIICAAVFVVPFGISVIGGTPYFPTFSIWSWAPFGFLGMPEWLIITASWLFWTAVVVAGIVVTIRWSRRQRSAPGGAPSGTASTQAAPETPTPPAFTAAPDTPRSTPYDAPPADNPPTDWVARLNADATEFGRRAGEWGERVGAQAEAWSNTVTEQYAARRIGAAHTVLTLAAALLAGGGAALWALNTGVEVNAMIGAPGALVAAVIAVSAVCAVSVIIAGVRGRHTGWVGFFATCGVVAMLFCAVIPWGSRFTPFGTVELTGVSTEAPGTAMLAGTIHVDLTSLDSVSTNDQSPANAAALSSPENNRDLAIWMAAGRATVALPDEQPVVLDVRVLAGNVKEAHLDGVRVSGPFLHRTITANLPTSGSTVDATHISVTLLAGNVEVTGGDSVSPTPRGNAANTTATTGTANMTGTAVTTGTADATATSTSAHTHEGALR